MYKKTNIINLFVNYSGLLLGFVNTFLKSKTLSLEEIGLISTMLTISGLTVVLINNSIPNVIQKFYYNFKEDINNKSSFIKLNFVVSSSIFFITSILLLLFKSVILTRYNSPLVERYYYYVFFLIFAEYLSAIYSFIFRMEFLSAIGNFIRTFLRSFLNTMFLIAILLFDLSFKTYFILFISVQFVQLILFMTFFTVKIDFNISSKFNFDSHSLKQFLNYGFFMFFSSLAGYLTTTVDKLMIGAMINLSELGVYTISISLVLFLKVIGTSFQNVYHPMISSFWSKNDVSGINRVYKENTNIQLYLGLLLFIFLNVFSTPILNIFGKSFVSGAVVLLFVSLGEVVNLGTGMCGGVIAFSKYYKFDFFSRLILMVLAILTNILLIPKFGINGAAFASFISLACYNIAKVLFVKIKLKLLPYNLTSIKIISIGIIFFFIVKYCQIFMNLKNIIQIALFCLLITFLYLLIGVHLLKLDFLTKVYRDIRKKL